MASRISPRPTAVAVVAIFSFCGIASAGDAPPNFLMRWDASNDAVGPNTYNWNQFGNQPEYGTWTVPHAPGTWTGWNYNGSLPGPGGNTWNLTWLCVFNDNAGGVATGVPAFVTANMVVTNFGPVTSNFSMLMTLPILKAIPIALERGSIAGTVTDFAGNGATVSAPAALRIYTPRIDGPGTPSPAPGADEVPGYLMPFGFSASALPFDTAVVGPASFGTPTKVLATQSVDTNIQIFLSFNLTPGDSASFTSIFEVNPIPGPGGLVALAALGLMRRRRR